MTLPSRRGCIAVTLVLATLAATGCATTRKTNQPPTPGDSTSQTATRPVSPTAPGATFTAPSTQPSRTRSPTTAAPSATHASTPIAPVRAPSGSADKRPAACTDGQVRVEGTGGQGAGGAFIGYTSFTLVGTTPCTLDGYPGLDVTTTAGTEHAARGNSFMGATPTARSPLTLAPTLPAIVSFGWEEGCGIANTPTLVSIAITPPGLHQATTMTAKSLKITSEVCTQPMIEYVVRHH